VCWGRKRLPRRSQQESIAMRKAAPRKSIPACSTLTEKSLEEAFYPPRFRRKPAERPETTPVEGLRAKCPPPVTGCLRCLHFQGPAARPRPRVILLTVHLLRGLSEVDFVFGLEHCIVSFRHHHPHNLHNPQIHNPTVLLHIISLLPSIILILIIQ
jgi:hypothetical protein